MEKVLIVVDMQKDFTDGSLGSPQARGIVERVRAKIAEYAKRGDKVYFTRDTHGSDYLNTQEGKYLPVPHCIKDTDGWKIYGGLDNGAGFRYIDKPHFGWRRWDETLSGIDADTEIELCGLCTDICVVSNAVILKAFFPENKIAVDASCCAGVTEESHKAALLTMKMCQVDVINYDI